MSVMLVGRKGVKCWAVEWADCSSVSVDVSVSLDYRTQLSGHYKKLSINHLSRRYIESFLGYDA